MDNSNGMDVDHVDEEDTVEEVIVEGENEQVEEEEHENNSVQAFLSHTDEVFGVGLHPTLAVAATGGADEKAYVWEITSGESLFELSGHKDSVISCKFNHDGKILATASLDGQVKLWDYANNCQLLITLEGPSGGEEGGIEWIQWHQKGNVLLAGAADSTCWMWLSNGTCMNVFAGHAGPVSCGSFTCDGKLVVTGSVDGTARVWDPKTASTIHLYQGHGFHDNEVHSLAVHPQNPGVFVTGSLDATAKLCSTSSVKVLGTLKQHTEPIETVGFSYTHPYVATGSLDEKLIIWDTNTLQVRQTCQHDGGIAKLLWHPTQPLVFTCSNKTLRVWDSRTGNCERTWNGHYATIWDFAINADGSVITTVSEDHAALVFSFDE